jgi:hypothetical protein
VVHAVARTASPGDTSLHKAPPVGPLDHRSRPWALGGWSSGVNEYVRPVFVGVSDVARSHDMSDQPAWDSGQRFRPVGAVAQALIEYVDREYDVVIDAPVALPPTRARRLGHDVSRIVRISSGRSGEVTVWLVFGSAPGVISVLAGLFSDFEMWFCGCDSCDETWQEVADALEEVFLQLARGGVTEGLEPGRSGRARWSLTSSSGDWSGLMPLKRVRKRQLHRWAEQLAQLPGGRWSGWTPRVTACDHCG